MKKLISLLAILFTAFGVAAAQELQTPEMADPLRQSGKIYVVVGVIAIIFIGIVVYIIAIDSRVSRLEKSIKDKERQS
jgi:CcmD family protein